MVEVFDLNEYTEIHFRTDGVPLSVKWVLDNAYACGMITLPTNEYLHAEVEAYLKQQGWDCIVEDPVFDEDTDLYSPIHLVN